MSELIPIEQMGTVGMLTDIPPYQIPPAGWSGGSNVRFDDVSVRKSLGFQEVMSGLTFPPLHLETYQEYDERRYYWIAFGEKDMLYGMGLNGRMLHLIPLHLVTP